jgi:hypothetical protein
MPASLYGERMTRALSALAVAALLTLVGCAPAEPEAEPSVAPSVAEPSSTPAPDPVVDTIVFRAESIELVGDGQVLDELAIDGSTEAAIESLTEVIGAPEYSLVPPGECNDEFDQYLWPDVMVINSPGRPLGSFSLRVFAADAPGVEGESVQLQGPAGEQVGDDLSAFIAATNPALVETFLTSDIVLLEVGWLSSGFTAGVAAFADGGIVDNMGVPIAVNSGLDC